MQLLLVIELVIVIVTLKIVIITGLFDNFYVVFEGLCYEGCFFRLEHNNFTLLAKKIILKSNL